VPRAKTLKRQTRKMPKTKPNDGLELCCCCCCEAEAVPNPDDEDESVAVEAEVVVTSVPGAADTNAML